MIFWYSVEESPEIPAPIDPTLPPSEEAAEQEFVKLSIFNNKIQIIEDQEEPFEDYAFDRNGEWDEIPIFNTNDWPELCRNGKF